MRKAMLAILLLVVLTVPALAETVSWTLPTQYVDNTAISVPDRSSIVVGLYANGSKFTSAGPGATSWTGTLPLARGVSGTYTLTSTLNGLESVQSGGVSYTVPFAPTKAPAALSITQ